MGGRLMTTVGPLAGITQAACPSDADTKMVHCDWQTSYSLAVPANWPSGAYLAKLRNAQGYANYISFVVRDDASSSAILMQNSTNTWEAYNKWGGASVYPSGYTHGVKVSYDRPYSGKGSSYMTTELQFIRFVEREGYDVTYSTDVDTHERGSLLLNHRAFISIGHDEYWSWEMRDAVEAARDAGVNVGFFGGNDSYWQVRYEQSTSGDPDRVIVGYKERYKEDPYYTSGDSELIRRTTAKWRSGFIGRPEQPMMGVMYGTNLGTHSDLPYTVNNASNWAYAGTGVTNGQKLTYIVGREYDRVSSSYPMPASTSFTILATTINPTTGSRQNSVMYQAPSGAFVFAAGTMDWSWGLDTFGDHNRVSPAIQQMTRNILNRFSGL
jgi:hypothetical protein